MEENSRPLSTLPSIHQAQGQLCVCTVGGVTGHNMSQLSVWVLEDYATNKWILKHTVSTLKVFGKLIFNLVTWIMIWTI
jgi:hypothetical protein